MEVAQNNTVAPSLGDKTNSLVQCTGTALIDAPPKQQEDGASTLQEVVPPAVVPKESANSTCVSSTASVNRDLENDIDSSAGATQPAMNESESASHVTQSGEENRNSKENEIKKENKGAEENDVPSMTNCIKEGANECVEKSDNRERNDLDMKSTSTLDETAKADKQEENFDDNLEKTNIQEVPEVSEQEELTGKMDDVTVSTDATREENSDGSSSVYTAPGTCQGVSVLKNNTYDISDASDSREVNDVLTDDSLATDSYKDQGRIDPNSSFTEESLGSIGNECYEAEDETDPRPNSNSEMSSDSCDSPQKVKQEEGDSLDASPSETCGPEEFLPDKGTPYDLQHIQNEEKSPVKDEKHISEPVEVSKGPKSPKLAKRAAQERSSFRKRMGSFRKGKKTNEEFSIEIFESKKPTNLRVEEVRQSLHGGSTESLPNAQNLPERLVRAQSEPPQLGEGNTSSLGETTESREGASAGEQPASLSSSIALDGSTTLSQTSESSSGVTGELTSTANEGEYY